MSKAKKGGKSRAGRKTTYYAAGYLRTTRNKSRHALKRQAKRLNWLTKGVKKNGEPVKGATAPLVTTIEPA